MFLKRMFYASASILMLAGAYHLGAQNAGAQAGGAMEVASISTPPFSNATASFVVNRVLYTSQYTNGGYWWPIPAQASTVGPIPGTAPIAAAYGPAGFVLLTNGDVYRAGGSGTWEYGGNLLGGAVPATQSTFGALKAKYR